MRTNYHCGILNRTLVISDSFYRTKEQASGISLSFVNQILRLHNASIRVQSIVGQGSVCSINFPLPVS